MLPTNPQPNYSYQVGGCLSVDAPTYVRREADAQLYLGLKEGHFCYVLNSRQMGKSSLRVQTMRRLEEEGVACAAIDLTAIGSQDITAEQWYGGILFSLASGFELLDKFDLFGWWGDRSLLSPMQRLSQFIDEVLLVEVTGNISIFIDEIDSILSLGFNADDFLGWIRACYNKRPDSEKYRRLSFALLGVATPSDLIRNRNISTPFNIGKAIELRGFKLEEAMPLARGFEGVFPEAIAVLKEILDWTGGQPFLTQKVCQLVLEAAGEEGQENIGEWVAGVVRSRVIENWEGQDEPEHLKTIRDRLLYSSHHKEELLLSYRQILREGEIRVSNKPEQTELPLTGLVVKRGGKLTVYNRIYAAVFNLSWVERELREMSPPYESFDVYLEPEKLQDCCNKIVEPGALIRIKGPHKTGKTLLLNKIVDRANEEGYDLAIVNFAETDGEVLSDYQKLLRWFCVCLGDELDFEDKVDEQFKEVFGSSKNCTNYLERYLLKGRSQPLVLVLEGVDAVFEVASFNNDFCKLLREWNNAANVASRRRKIWQQVRSIIVHSTEVYGGLDINSSPLAGVGLTVALSGFSLEQVKQLAGCYGLGLNDGEVRQLMEAFGGHPYLVKNALVFLKKGEFNLTELLAVAPTEASPFGNHLRELLGRLERQPDLTAAYLEVLGQNRPVQLATNFTFKLESMGLVKVEKDFCLPYCEVYRQYFFSRLKG